MNLPEIKVPIKMPEVKPSKIEQVIYIHTSGITLESRDAFISSILSQHGGTWERMNDPGNLTLGIYKEIEFPKQYSVKDLEDLCDEFHTGLVHDQGAYNFIEFLKDQK